MLSSDERAKGLAPMMEIQPGRRVLEPHQARPTRASSRRFRDRTRVMGSTEIQREVVRRGNTVRRQRRRHPGGVVHLLGLSTRRRRERGGAMQLVQARKPHWQWIAAELVAAPAKDASSASSPTITDAAPAFLRQPAQRAAHGQLRHRARGRTFPGRARGRLRLCQPRASARAARIRALQIGGQPRIRALADGDDARMARAQGHGKAMIQAALGTPAGRIAHLVRVNREGSTRRSCTRCCAPAPTKSHARRRGGALVPAPGRFPRRCAAPCAAGTAQAAARV